MLKKLFQLLFRKKELKIIHKTIFNWHQKNSKEIYKILELEVASFQQKNSGFKLKHISKPKYTTTGGLVYQLTFKN